MRKLAILVLLSPLLLCLPVRKAHAGTDEYLNETVAGRAKVGESSKGGPVLTGTLGPDGKVRALPSDDAGALKVNAFSALPNDDKCVSPDAGTDWCCFGAWSGIKLQIEAGPVATLWWRKRPLPDAGAASTTDHSVAAGAVQTGPEAPADALPDGGYELCFHTSAADPTAGVSTVP